MQVNFLTGGTQKGSTGAVHKFLSEHPQICLAKQKEVHFFDNDAFFRTHREPINYRPYHEYFTGRATTKVFGEATPIYMYWEPSAERIKAYNPSMRLIFILRDPIERAYSQYNMQRRRGIELLSFSTAIRLESVRCRQAFCLQRRRYSYVDRGFYLTCSPKTDPATMRVQPPTMGTPRRTLYGQTTLPGADRPQATPGGRKAHLRCLG